MSEIRVSEIRVSKIRVSEIRVSEIRVSEIRISSNHRELHGAIFSTAGGGGLRGCTFEKVGATEILRKFFVCAAPNWGWSLCFSGSGRGLETPLERAPP